LPGPIGPGFRNLLRMSCGLTGSILGDIDFTGQWHPEEPLPVLRPCLTLANDNTGRRWIAEVTDDGDFPGPVWCVFPDPAVIVYVSDDLAEFVSMLHEQVRCGRMRDWLRSLRAEARVVWMRGRTLGTRSRNKGLRDPAVGAWVASLPSDSYVYDLRAPYIARGWPYGLAGRSCHAYRCGKLPVFAVAACPTQDDAAQPPTPSPDII
jgi:hypothetical protein